MVRTSAVTKLNGPCVLQWSVAEVLDDHIELGRYPRPGTSERVNAQSVDRLVHPPSGDAGKVAVRDHSDQRRLGTPAAFGNPSGK